MARLSIFSTRSPRLAVLPTCALRSGAWLTGLLLSIGSATVLAADSAAHELPPVYVHADEDDFQARQDASSTMLVYGREELDRMNELTVGDYLRRLPGVTFTGPPGNPKDVRVRGMDKGYTQILIDGEAVSGGTKERQLQVDRIPLDMIERIELVRAPTAGMPNEGLMGTINIVLRDAPDRRVASARLVGGRLFGDLARKDSWNLSGQFGDAAGNARWLVNAAVGQRGDLKSKSKDETGFANNAENLPNSRKLEYEDERVSVDTLDFSPRLNLRLSAHDELVFTPWVSRSDESKAKSKDKLGYVGAPFTDPESITAEGRELEEEDKLRETFRLRGEWRRKLDSGQFAAYAAWQQGSEEKDKSKLDYNAAGNLTRITLEVDDKDEREWYTGFRLERTLGRHKPSVGLEYRDLARKDQKTRLEGNDWDLLVPRDPGRGDHFDIDERRWIAWLQDEIDLGSNHLLTPGVRAIRSRQSAVDALGERSGDTTASISPSVHHLWRIDPRNNLRASLAQTLRPPKFDDLSTVIEAADGTVSRPDKGGNPGLKPEKAIGLELGWDHFLADRGGVLGANFFHRDIRDKVEKLTALEGERYVERPRNLGDAQVWGWELDARPQLDVIGMPELMLRFNYTRLYSRIDDATTGTRTRIKDQPPYAYNLGFDWQLVNWDAAWGANYNYTPRYLKNPMEPLKADDEAEQKLLDLYLLKRFSQDVSLRLTVSNLLDMEKFKRKEHFRDNGTRDKFGIERELGGTFLQLALEGRF